MLMGVVMRLIGQYRSSDPRQLQLQSQPIFITGESAHKGYGILTARQTPGFDNSRPYQLSSAATRFPTATYSQLRQPCPSQDVCDR